MNDHTDEINKLKEQVLELQRFRRDLLIISVVVGACVTAFLGYQSFVGIPRAVEDSFKEKALAEVSAKANERLDEIKAIAKKAANFEQMASQSQKTAKASADAVASLKNDLDARFNKKFKDLAQESARVLEKIKASSTDKVFRFENGCKSPVKLAIWYRAAFGASYGAKWFKFSPDESSVLAKTGVGRVRLGFPEIYYYAEATDDSKRVWKGESSIYIEGKEYNMRKATFSDEGDEYKLKITCD